MSALRLLCVSDVQRRASSRATGWLTRFRFRLEDFFLLRGLDIGVGGVRRWRLIMYKRLAARDEPLRTG